VNLVIFDRKVNRNVDFFAKFSLTLKYDAVGSVFTFEFYYNPELPEHRILAAPGRYNLAKVYHEGELLLTGFILSQSFDKKSTEELTPFSGYSVPGVLEDSQIPPTAYPLQSDGLSLKQIAQKLLKPFQIKMDIDSHVSGIMDEVYEKATAEPGETVKEFLCKLATQKNIIVSHTPKGHLLFTQARTNVSPSYHFDGNMPGTTMSLSFNGQGMHSPIWVIKQASKKGGNAGQAKILNPYVPIDTTAFRPKVIIQSSGTDNDTIKTAKNELAEELKNIVLTITTDRWKVGPNAVKPNNTITVTAPELFIFKKTPFFVESVKLDGDSQKLTATLTCVLPEVYNGAAPKNIFTQ
jgi:prophage tail gpP-like protein